MTEENENKIDEETVEQILEDASEDLLDEQDEADAAAAIAALGIEPVIGEAAEVHDGTDENEDLHEAASAAANFGVFGNMQARAAKSAYAQPDVDDEELMDLAVETSDEEDASHAADLTVVMPPIASEEQAPISLDDMDASGDKAADAITAFDDLAEESEEDLVSREIDSSEEAEAPQSVDQIEEVDLSEDLTQKMAPVAVEEESAIIEDLPVRPQHADMSQINVSEASDEPIDVDEDFTSEEDLDFGDAPAVPAHSAEDALVAGDLVVPAVAVEKDSNLDAENLDAKEAAEDQAEFGSESALEENVDAYLEPQAEAESETVTLSESGAGNDSEASLESLDISESAAELQMDEEPSVEAAVEEPHPEAESIADSAEADSSLVPEAEEPADDASDLADAVPAAAVAAAGATAVAAGVLADAGEEDVVASEGEATEVAAEDELRADDPSITNVMAPIFMPEDPAETTSTYVNAFYAELKRCGVHDFVVSPGSRSTALACKALERFGDVYVDIDERGAAFFALGLAKAKREPVAVICTSGTAVANWMPAILEAEASRVPLLFLSADRPPHLQQVGAPQTCDQLKIFGDHVKKFVQMPLPSKDAATLAYVRQIAFDACVAAHGAMPGAVSCDAGPVHLNFPFDEPLMPAAGVDDPEDSMLPPTVIPGHVMLQRDAEGVYRAIKGKRVIALCGEGSCNSPEEAQSLIDFAHTRNVVLFADPLSGLRSYNDPFIIDNYDAVFTHEGAPAPEVIVRFGRWPVSKRCYQAISAANPIQIVVDMRDARDMSASTSMLLRATPTVFAQGLEHVTEQGGADEIFADEWIRLNTDASKRIRTVTALPSVDEYEGAYVAHAIEMAPEDSLLFCANSMSIRAVDTFYCKADKQLHVLCNRGLSGIDGTLSSAIGAAQAFKTTTLITGDLAMLHDINALALQNEMRIREERGTATAPSIVIVLLDNNGGGIFEMLPQKSDEDYYDRLFSTPQNVSFRGMAQAFDIPFSCITKVSDFKRAYTTALHTPGISIIDVMTARNGIKERYDRFR